MPNKVSKNKLSVGKSLFFLLLGSLFAALAYSSPASNRVQAESSFNVTAVPTSTVSGATTTYTFSFNAPKNLSAGNPQLGQPGDVIMFNAWPNGPQEAGSTVNFTQATLAAGSSVGGQISRADDFSDNMTMLMLGSSVSAGTPIVVKLAGVVNPTWIGQQTFSVHIGDQNGYDGQYSVLLGAGQTYTVSGQITRADTGVGVSGAQINANQRSGTMFLGASADSEGRYSINLPVGTWELRVEPQWGNNGRQVAVDWAFAKQGIVVTISDSGKTAVNFQVVSATARVIGKVLLPDGTPMQRGGVDIRSTEGVGVGTGADPSDGSFSVQVPAGNYRLGVFSEDQSYTAPVMEPFTAKGGATTDVGTVRLVKKTAHIQGRVTVKGTETGVSGVRVNTWNPRGGGWAEAQTNASGTFDLLVGAGDWEVMAEPNPGSGYAFESGPPTVVKVVANQTVGNINFTVLRASAVINGRIVDGQGALLSNFFGYAMAMEGSGDPPKPGPGTNVQGGQFALRVPAGTWTVDVHTEPGSEFSSAGGQTVTLADNGTASVQVVMKKNDAVVSGRVIDEDGTAVTGVRTEVFAENGRGSFKMAEVSETGTYRMGVVGGTSWHLGVFVEPNSGYMMLPPSDSKVTVASGATVTKDFTLLRTNAYIAGKVLDPNGVGLGNVFVFADTNLTVDGDVLGLRVENAGAPMGAPKKADLRQGIHTGDLTAADGTFRLAVPAGTYGIGSGAPSALGYINPVFRRIAVEKDREVTGIVLQYRQADAQISGAVYLAGSKSEGFVWAWSENGAHSEAHTRTGDYSLNVTKGEVWHVGADFEGGQEFYQSQEVMIDLTSATSAQKDLVLVKSSFVLPPSVSQQIQAASGGTIQMQDGTRLVIPAGAFGSSGTFNVTISPTAQLTKEKHRRPVAFGYSINATNASTGQEFTTPFSTNVQLVIPYTAEMLTALGISANDIGASYFDASSSGWQGVDSFTVNKEDKTIIASIGHFTDFAVTTGASDTTPPANPTSVTATAGIEKVTLSWVNPTDTDFNHIAIYRSTVSGEVGTKIGQTAAVATIIYEDTGLTAGTVYYYTLRSVDNLNNESVGGSQVSATPTAAAALPATGVPLSSALVFYLIQLVLVGSGVALLLFAVRWYRLNFR